MEDLDQIVKMKQIAFALLLFFAGCKTHREFVQIRDTIITKESKLDTLWRPGTIDTLYLNKDKLHVRVETRVDTVTKKQVVRVSGKCEPDTIVRNIYVEAPVPEQHKPAKMRFWDYVELFFANLLLVVLVYSILRFIWSFLK